MCRFEGILVYEDGLDVFARNADGRVLFRFNKMDSSFAVFRSPRMTDDEKDLCLMFFEKLSNELTGSTYAGIKDALDYNTEEDLYCT